MTTDRTASMGAESTQRLQEAATGIAHQAERTAEAQASKRMTQAGETLEQVAEAVREAGEALRDRQPFVADLADSAAQRVEQASSYLKTGDAGQALRSAEEFARRQPLAIVGGGLVLGLVVGRLLRSTGSSAGAAATTDSSSADDTAWAHSNGTTISTSTSPWVEGSGATALGGSVGAASADTLPSAVGTGLGEDDSIGARPADGAEAVPAGDRGY